ncbi:MAG: DUF2382 domain-containing protein [Thermomicrobia bacterium]|nr:DUF2382 domain-containing protein [Thermomicrobia bacterium]MCA1723046.1 DUF2382 domain-containing protein [Thermomicrobia bacterium]
MTMGRSDYGQTNTGAYNYADRLTAGADVYGADNEKIGTVADVGQNYFLVQKGWLFIKDLYLPTSTITQADGNNVYLSLTKQQAEERGRDMLPTEGDAWYGTQRTGATTAGTDYATDREVGRGVTRGENVTVPIVEEQLKAGVRETEGGRARIVKDVRQEQQTIDVPVEREEVYVTERAVNRPATEADLNMRDRNIEIPLKEQEVVTQKQAMVTGEVNVRKETVADTERVTDTVRREEVHVEDASNPRVHVEGERGTTGRTASGTTDTAYDRNAADRSGEGIMDRAKDKMRDGEGTMRNR